MATRHGFGWEAVSPQGQQRAERFYEDLMGRRRGPAPLDPGRYDESHTDDRIEQFRQENAQLPVDRTNVILFGSSSMEGNFHAWPKKHIQVPNVLNRGIFGQSIAHLEARLQVSVFDARPSHVFILNGRNDLFNGRSVSRTATTYRRVVDAIRTHVPHVVICIVTCAPVYNEAARIARQVVELNAQLLAMATSIPTWGLDLHSFLADGQGMMRPEYRKPKDKGLHFSEAGYRVFGERITHVVKSTRSQPPPPPEILSWHRRFR